MTVLSEQGYVQRRAGVVGALRSLIMGTLLCLTPPTSLIVLGWLQGDMRRVARRRAGLPIRSRDISGWITGAPDGGRVARAFGGLASNIRDGANLALGMLIATLPFTAFWLTAWWAGWENSFNKGYEQAFVGPLVGFSGIAVFILVMIYLPMAVAHQAVERRPLAFLELRRVRSAVAHSGWRYVWLAFTTVIFALPIFASRGLPTFAEGVYPGIADMTPEQIANLNLGINVLVAGYIFVTLVILRRWGARIYSDAVWRAAVGPDHELWEDSDLLAAVDGQVITTRRPWRSFRLIRFLFLVPIWFALAALIYVGQFLNHDWHVWMTHPYVFLPWTM